MECAAKNAKGDPHVSHMPDCVSTHFLGTVVPLYPIMGEGLWAVIPWAPLYLCTLPRHCWFPLYAISVYAMPMRPHEACCTPIMPTALPHTHVYPPFTHRHTSREGVNGLCKMMHVLPYIHARRAANVNPSHAPHTSSRTHSHPLRGPQSSPAWTRDGAGSRTRL